MEVQFNSRDLHCIPNLARVFIFGVPTLLRSLYFSTRAQCKKRLKTKRSMHQKRKKKWMTVVTMDLDS